MTKQSVQDALVERLRKPIDADKIYDWIVQKREETTSDLPRQGFQNEMELIDEDRAEAAASIVIMQQTIAAHRELGAKEERERMVKGWLSSIERGEHLAKGE